MVFLDKILLLFFLLFLVWWVIFICLWRYLFHIIISWCDFFRRWLGKHFSICNPDSLLTYIVNPHGKYSVGLQTLGVESIIPGEGDIPPSDPSAISDVVRDHLIWFITGDQVLLGARRWQAFLRDRCVKFREFTFQSSISCGTVGVVVQAIGLSDVFARRYGFTCLGR